MTVATYKLQQISAIQIEVISSRIYLIGLNESKLNGHKRTQMSLKQAKRA